MTRAGAEATLQQKDEAVLLVFSAFHSNPIFHIHCIAGTFQETHE